MNKFREQTIFPTLEHRWTEDGELEQKVEIIQHYNTNDNEIGIRTEWWKAKDTNGVIIRRPDLKAIIDSVG